MSNVAISALPAASTLTGNEVVPLVQSGTTSQTTAEQIASLANIWNLVTTNFAISKNTKTQVNTSGGTIAASTPTTPSVMDSFDLQDAEGTWATNNLTITYNGTDKLNGLAADFVADVSYAKLTAVYISDGYGWSIK